MGMKVQLSHGRFVKLTPTEFFHLVQQLPEPNVIASKAGQYRYTVRYEGFIFHTQAERPLTFTNALQSHSTSPFVLGTMSSLRSSAT